MKRMIAAAAAACLAASGGNAASILTQIVDFTGTADLTDVKGITTNGALLPFFFFDTRVGTLNSIEFSANYNFLSTIAISGTGSGTAYVESAARFSSDDAGVTAALNSAINTLASVPIGGSALAPAAFDVVGGSSAYTAVAPLGALALSMGAASRPTITVTSAATLAAFSRVGTSSYNALLTTLTQTVLRQSAGSVTAGSTTILNGQLSIVYNITPLATPPGGGGGSTVPEPETWAMMLAGFGAIGATLRGGRRARRDRPATPLA